jgi:hypothetical protein
MNEGRITQDETLTNDFVLGSPFYFDSLCHVWTELSILTCPHFTTWGRTDWRSPPSTGPLLLCAYSLLRKLYCFRSNGLVSTSLHLSIFVSMDTFVKHPAMVSVQESSLRGNVFANSFPRNAYMSQYIKFTNMHKMFSLVKKCLGRPMCSLIIWARGNPFPALCSICQ